MRKIAVAGNVTRDAVTRKAGETNATSFGLASNFKVKGEESVLFFDCTIWGDRGKALAEYIVKGRPVTVSGDFSTHENEDKTYLDIRVDDIALQGGKQEEEESKKPAGKKGYKK